MVPDLTLEVIYLDQPTDFKMEFELCSSSNVRFLSLPVKSHAEFLSAISKSVVRSRVIIAVGSFNPSDKLYIPKIIAKATGYELSQVQKEIFGIVSVDSVLLPKSALPLVDANGNLGGAVLESNDQSIIMLTSDKELRFDIVKNLVCPYLKLFADKKTFSGIADVIDDKTRQESVEINTSSAPIENPEPLIEPQEIPIEPQIEPAALVNPQLDDGVIAAEPQEETEIKIEQEPAKIVEPYVGEGQKEKIEQIETVEPEYSIIEQPEVYQNPNFSLQGFLIDDSEEKRNPKNIKALIKVSISIILVIVVILATYFGYDRLFQPMQRNKVYDEVRKLYGQTWGELPEDMLYKFGKLYQTNSDIYGWLSIPTTNINLPVVSLSKKTAGYYRAHLFDGSVNRYGTLYTTSTAVKGSYQRNIVIYGNDTGDGVMFSDLDKFLSVEYYKEVPAFTFDTLYLENKWKIFSVFKIKSKNRNNYLKTSFFDDAEFLEYIKILEKVSVIDTNIDITESDQIVTLVSQSDGNDVVLVARKVRAGESPMVDITGAAENYTAQNSSDIPVIVNPLQPIESSSKNKGTSEIKDSNLKDGASSRYEQKEPLASAIVIKPTASSTPSQSDITSNISSENISSENVDVSSTFSGSIDELNAKLPMLTVTNVSNGAKIKDTAISIIAQNIEAEMGESYHIEALKAQAVAAYSWLLNNGSANDKYPSLPLKTPSQKSLEAAAAVAGQVAVYNGQIATTVYHAMSAGRTANSQDIWSNAIPYLVSVDSSVDKNNEKGVFETQRKFSSEKIAIIAETLLGINLRTLTDKSKWFKCTYDANSIYCTKISIGSIEQKGTYMRDVFFDSSEKAFKNKTYNNEPLVQAKDALRSSAYTIEYNAVEDTFTFTVRGYGHGVGMSQVGADAYANNGWDYEKILKHYYTGITLGTYYVN